MVTLRNTVKTNKDAVPALVSGGQNFHFWYQKPLGHNYLIPGWVDRYN